MGQFLACHDRQTGRLPGFLCLFFICALLCAACARKDDALSALDKATDTLQRGIAEKDTAQVLGLLHADFAARAPDENRDWAKRVLFAAFSRHKNIRVMTLRLENRLSPGTPDRAISEGEILLIGADGLIPENANRYQVRLGWIQQNGAWRLLRLEFSAP
ncbi:MAG: hypothetical protein LBG69_08220 [Zoogloeaceae bacterium]|nr:hypothetical protein [Zoogloeaceae bacterium]